MKQIAESLQPASEFLSVLGSFAMCAFYARAMGEAAFRRLRACAGRALGGYRMDWRWGRMPFEFLAATALAAAVVLILQGVLAEAPSAHASFTAVLVSTLLGQTSERGARFALLVFFALVAGARVLLGTEVLSLTGGLVLGLACVLTVQRCSRSN